MATRIKQFLVFGCLCTVSLLGMLCIPRSVFAHDHHPERTMIVQWDDRGAAILWRMHVAGWRAHMLGTVHDVDHDQHLSSDEKRNLAGALVRKSMIGVKVFADDQPLAMDGMQFTVDADALVQGKTVAFGLLEGVVRIAAPLRHGAHRLRVVLQKGTGPLAVTMQIASPWRVNDIARTPHAIEHSPGTVFMHAGDTWERHVQY